MNLQSAFCFVGRNVLPQLRKRYPICLLIAFVGLTGCSEKKSFQEAQRPNVIIIYADDLGWNQLSSYGNTKIKTPNIDRIGEDGVRFTQAYATAPICSPSRCGLLTGRYQQRFGAEFLVATERPPSLADEALKAKITQEAIDRGARQEQGIDTTGYRAIRKGIPESEKVIAEFFKEKGYATAAIGKWHAGEVDGLKPWQRGFDYFYGTLTWGTIYSSVEDPDIITRSYHFHTAQSKSVKRDGSLEIVRNGEVVEETGYLTDRIAEESIAFIDKHKQDPFFIYIPFTAVHDPFQAKKKDFDQIVTATDTTERIYLAMLASLDQAVGQITAKLKAEGLDQNTLIFFGSDNGGASYTRQMTNAPLKGGKLSHFEGGVRVPLLLKYPAKVPAGLIYEKPVSNLDIFQTAVTVIEGSFPDGRDYDGKDLIPYVNGLDKGVPHDALFWRNGYSKAVRQGDWKLYINERNKKTHLYNLNNDLGEKSDLSASNPEKVKALVALLENWESKLVKPSWPFLRSEQAQDIEESGYYFPI